HAHEPDLPHSRLGLAGLDWHLGDEGDTERPVRLRAGTARTLDFGRDLGAHVVPQRVAARRGERLHLQFAVTTPRGYPRAVLAADAPKASRTACTRRTARSGQDASHSRTASTIASRYFLKIAVRGRATRGRTARQLPGVEHDHGPNGITGEQSPS